MRRKKCSPKLSFSQRSTKILSTPCLDIHQFTIIKCKRSTETHFLASNKVSKLIRHGNKRCLTCKATDPPSDSGQQVLRHTESTRGHVSSRYKLSTCCRSYPQIQRSKGLCLRRSFPVNPRFKLSNKKVRSSSICVKSRCKWEMNNSCSADSSDQRSVSKAFTDLNSNLNNPHATDKHGKNTFYSDHIWYKLCSKY